MTAPTHVDDGAGHDTDDAGSHHGGRAGEDRTGQAGDGRRRGVPQAHAPAERGQSSEIRNQAWLLDQDEFATWLGVTERFIRRLVPERRTTFVKVGKQVRFDPADVVAWVEQRKVAAGIVTPLGEAPRQKGRCQP